MLAGAVPASQSLANRLISAGSDAGSELRGEDLNLVRWKWGSDRPVRVTLIDDEGWLSGGPAD